MSAVDDYQLLLRFHPDSEWADLAEFRIGMCGFLQIDGPWVDGRLIDTSLRQLKEYLRKYPSGLYREDAEEVVAALRRTGTDVLVNYLPVGSEEGARFYAECALEAGVAFVNCIPVFIASDPAFARRFEDVMRKHNAADYVKA